MHVAVDDMYDIHDVAQRLNGAIAAAKDSAYRKSL